MLFLLFLEHAFLCSKFALKISVAEKDFFRIVFFFLNFYLIVFFYFLFLSFRINLLILLVTGIFLIFFSSYKFEDTSSYLKKLSLYSHYQKYIQNNSKLILFWTIFEI